MKLVAHKRPASEKLDRLEYVRDDGSRSAIDMPRQGILPHDFAERFRNLPFVGVLNPEVYEAKMPPPTVAPPRPSAHS